MARFRRLTTLSKAKDNHNRLRFNKPGVTEAPGNRLAPGPWGQESERTMNYNLILDDILNWAAGYTGAPYMAIFCDPPYHLTTITKRFGKPGSAPAKGGVYRRSSAGFMGMRWDSVDESGKGIAFHPETWAALTQHLYPGGFIMAFAGTRGYHRMACAMEDAGLIIHPAIGWTFLSGFPKATRLDVQADRAAGVSGKTTEIEEPKRQRVMDFRMAQGGALKYEPATPLAQTWAGHRYGLQTLKPAFEFIAVAQKPYEGRPLDCITQTGAGALNIEAGRIPGPAWKWGTQTDIRGGGYGSNRPAGGDVYAEDIESNPAGRWPANLVLSHNPGCNGECEPNCPVRLLDEQSGIQRSGVAVGRNASAGNIYGGGKGLISQPKGNESLGYHDEGGASRMFFQSTWAYEVFEQVSQAEPLRYEPKVSQAERAAGLEDVKNDHPTLKPISLTKYLAGLLLPPDAYAPRRILCPFAGSGSEMIGAILAGWDEVTGIEASPNYHRIGEARLKWWSQWPGWGQTEVDKILAAMAKREEPKQAQQLGLFEEVAA